MYATPLTMTTRKPHELAKIQRRKWQRDVERECKLFRLGAEPIKLEPMVPLSDEVRLERKRLVGMLEYLNREGITEQQLRERQQVSKKVNAYKSRKRGTERSARQFVAGVLGTMRRKCRKYGIEFDLTIDDVVIPSHCPVLGIELKWCEKITDNTPSIDRFDPDGGYVKGNINVISFKANRFKNNATIDDLKAIVAWMEAMTPTTPKTE